MQDGEGKVRESANPDLMKEGEMDTGQMQ